jgi:heme oxygenase
LNTTKLDTRETLRRETRVDHRRVDDAFGMLDISTYNGLATFLQAHLLALAAIEPIVAWLTPTELRPPQMLELLQNDLARLDMKPLPSASFSHLNYSNPVGLSYVIAGSHLGSAFLRMTWNNTSDIRVLAAGNYRNSQKMRAYWPNLLLHFKHTNYDEEEIKLIVGGAKAAFNTFEHAFMISNEKEGQKNGELEVKQSGYQNRHCE